MCAGCQARTVWKPGEESPGKARLYLWGRGALSWVTVTMITVGPLGHAWCDFMGHRYNDNCWAIGPYMVRFRGSPLQ